MTQVTHLFVRIRQSVAVLAVALLLPWQTVPVLAQVALPAGAASALKIQVKEGEGALNNVRTQQAKPPVVAVTDASGRPVAGAQVTFLTPELGASAMFPSGNSSVVTTGPDGIAAVRSMKPNNVVGQFQIRVIASHQGQSARTAISQTNAAPAKSGGSAGKTALIVAILGGAGAAVAVGVTRGGSKSATPTSPSTSISAGGSSFGPPR